MILYNNKELYFIRYFGEYMEEKNFFEFHSDNNKLTEREFEVLRLVVKGKKNHEIARELNISIHTAKAHVCSILQKFAVNDRLQAAVKAIKSGMV